MRTITTHTRRPAVLPAQTQFDPHQELAAEVYTLLNRLNAMYRRQLAGDRSAYLRDRIRASEALIGALQGYPAAG